MRNAEMLLSMLFGKRIEMEQEASNKIDRLKKRGETENDIADKFLEMTYKRLERVAKLNELNAPKLIVDNEIRIVKEYITVIAVVAFKNTLQIDYYEKLMNDKGIDFESLE
jgi:hypothetical protein